MKYSQALHRFKKILYEQDSVDEYVLTAAEYDQFIENYTVEYIEAHIVFAIDELISERIAYDLSVISLIGLLQSYWMLRKPLKIYAPVFDQRIFTEKLLGRPSPGLPPPLRLAIL
jgi:hypothetical protein